MFELFSGWFGLIFLVVTAINAYGIKIRARALVKQDPNLEELYRELSWGYFIFMSPPWIIMTIGAITGGGPAIWHYFNPRGGNFYVLAFHFSIYTLWVLGVIWIYFKGGAEFLAKYWSPLSHRNKLSSPLWVKITFALGSVGALITIMMIWGYIPSFN